MNTLNFNAYDPKSPVQSEEFRVAKVMYKGKKDPETGKMVEPELANSCMLVDPIAALEVEENISALTPHIISYLEGVQDEIIKEAHKSGVEELAVSDISISAIIGKLESSASSGRLNAEEINRWFDATMAEQLIVRIADSMGVGEVPSEAEESKISLITETYRKLYSKLASGKTFYQEEQATKLMVAIDKTGADSSLIGSKFTMRLEKMIADGKELENCLLDL